MRPLIRFAPAAAVALALAAPAAAQAAVPGSPYSTAVLNDHPSAYYGLDETSGTTATDASPNHADGQYNGAVTLGAAAPFTPDAGTAVTLDKTETVTSTLGSGAGSAELWVKLNSTGGQTIVSQGDPATTGWSLGIGKTGSQKRKLIFTTGGKVTNSKLGMVANLWTQVLVAVDGSKIRFSTNGGSQLKSVTRQGSVPSPGSGSTLTIGSSTFAGSVDEVVVYPTALSQAEFNTHFGLTSYPLSTGAPAVSGPNNPPHIGDVLQATTGTWTSATQPLTYSYQWQRCDNLGANCLDVDGDTDSSYVLSAPDDGSTLHAIVTAVNTAETYPTATSTLSGVVAPVPPSETGAPSVSGAAFDGGALTADPGTWGGTQPLDYSYQWQECDGVTCSDVLGATGDTYDLSAGDIGHTLQVVVTAANHFGEHASATSSPSDVVAAVAPSNTTAPVLSGLAQEGGTLTVAPGLWTGTVPVDFTYQWQHCDAGGTNCVDVVGATGSSYLVTSADRGATLLAIVKATNVGGSQSVPTAPSAVVPTPSSGGSGGGTGGSGSGGGTTGGTTGTTGTTTGT